jgi:hypothetical protein
MDESEAKDLQQMAWAIQGATRKLNEVARSMEATTDELIALREDLGFQPPPQLRLVEVSDDA